MWGFSNPIGVAEWQIVCSIRVCFKKYIWICLLIYVQINIRTSQIYVYTDIDICKEIGNKNKKYHMFIWHSRMWQNLAY